MRSAGVDARETALERKFSDVTMLFSALDPRLAQVMFGKLARAVLKLDPDRRNNLLQRTILPGLLDGRANGKVLRDFPDIDLAESLCLLLDLETAAPEVLSAALNRLDLPPERRAALEPLIDERLRAWQRGEAETLSIGSLGHRPPRAGLIRVDAGRARLLRVRGVRSLDRRAQRRRHRRCARRHRSTPTRWRRSCDRASQLVRIEPNPDAGRSLPAPRARTARSRSSERSRWPDLIAELKGYHRARARNCRDARPDVADTITRKALSDFCTPSRLLALAELHERDDRGARHRRTTSRARLGPALVPGFDRAARSCRAPGEDARASRR